jgi:hypothetical protein
MLPGIVQGWHDPFISTAITDIGRIFFKMAQYWTFIELSWIGAPWKYGPGSAGFFPVVNLTYQSLLL